MEKIVGEVISKKSKIRYTVKWNTIEQTSWINIQDDVWIMVCSKVGSEVEALSCSQKFIDQQADAY